MLYGKVMLTRAREGALEWLLRNATSRRGQEMLQGLRNMRDQCVVWPDWTDQVYEELFRVTGDEIQVTYQTKAPKATQQPIHFRPSLQYVRR